MDAIDDALALLRSEIEWLRGIEEAAGFAEDELRKHGTGVDLIGARHRLYAALARPDRQEEGDA